MSQKINSKNLSYSSELPPFLARLRGQGGRYGDNDGPDQILAARRRPAGRHVRTASEEAEDAPIVVDEEGNVVDLREKDVDGLAQEKEEEKDSDEKEKEESRKRETEKARVASIGASKKRKVGRLIGGDADDDKGDSNIAKAARDVRRILNTEADADSARQGANKKKYEKTTDAATTTTTGKSKITANKKKAKKIKLSFGDDAD
ncbi:hypothetical protein F5X99DRAFT_407157 [Biscogniauxia marginata]|nr:hypothetical protein F5X99DRAFT_407157 [Biscogniauxia marginata]